MNELQLDIGLGKALAILNFFLLFFLLGGSSVGLGASYRGAFAPKNGWGQILHYKPSKAGTSNLYQSVAIL